MMIQIERPVFLMLILAALSVAMTLLVFPSIFRIARMKGLVDNPNIRKLQKEPVPVVGGLAVFFGIVVSLCFFKTTVNHVNLFSVLCAMMVMLYVGAMDDILDIRAGYKFTAEILVCLLVLYGTRALINNFQGLLGLCKMPVAIAIPFSTLAMVGIVNSINLIDGVDGLASGMCIFILGIFSLFLFLAHEYSFCALSVICAGSLIPFFFYNVFSKKSKMFLGDGGALMIGVAIASITVNILKGKGMAYTDFIADFERMSLVSFCLAALSIPVFDTLRVMFGRIIRGIGPFYADRTHLHHKLLEKGYSHIRVSMTEIALNASVVAIWFVSFLMGAGVNLQFAVVVLSSLAAINAFRFLPSVSRERM